MDNVPKVIMSIDAGVAEQSVKVVLNALNDNMWVDSQDRDEW